jgi:SAM-dependent methyltransferase
MFFKIGKNKGPSGEAMHSTHSLTSFPLRPPLLLPKGISREKLFDWLKTVRVEDAPELISDYCTQDFERFLYTFGLVQHIDLNPSLKLKGLELGANPYFMTMLLKHYTSVEWSLANYFSDGVAKGRYSQGVDFSDPTDLSLPKYLKLEYFHFNIEEDEFPFRTASFDIVLFCEIIEHLLMDPCAAIREIRRVLRNDGALILTTPNANCLENVARMITGTNMYDLYSA